MYFVTFRLADSIPQARLRLWRVQMEQWLSFHPKPWSMQDLREYSQLFPERLQVWLDAGYGSCALREMAISEIVEGSLVHFDRQRYRLDHFVIMPNHVHVIVVPLAGFALPGILHSWKSFTAKEINKKLKKTGAFWQAESYDHIVRSKSQLDFYRSYIAGNPEKARLSSSEYRLQCGLGVSSD